MRPASPPLALLLSLPLALPLLPRLAHAEAGYDPDQGAYLRSADGRFQLQPYAMVQLQHTATTDGGIRGFQVRAAKWILRATDRETHVVTHAQLNVGDGRAAAEDVYVRWTPRPWLALTVGQIEVPYSRQALVLEAYQQLVDRSTVSARFGLQRDQGVALRLGERPLELTLGAWNGTRQNATDDDGALLGTARLTLQPYGPVPFDESDLADTKEPRFAITLAGAWNPRRTVVPDATKPQATVELARIGQGVLEVNLRHRGLSLASELHVRRLERGGARAVDWGELLQIGWFVLPRRVELAARFSRTTGAVAADDPVEEEALGVNWFLRGHRLKVQLAGTTTRTLRGRRDTRLRTQVEVFL